MAVQQARVPVLDESGRFPDAYAPPSVAADTQAAQDARVGAESARDEAVTARGQAEVARQGAQQALAGVPSAVEGALDTQVQAAQSAASAAQTSEVSAANNAASASAAAETATTMAAQTVALQDGAVKSLIADEYSDTRTELNAAFAPLDAVSARPGAFAAIMSGVQFQVPTAFNIIGDSTGNGIAPNPEWVYYVTEWLAEQSPTTSVYLHNWDTNIGDYSSRLTLQEGAGGRRGIQTGTWGDAYNSYVAIDDSPLNSITGDIDIRIDCAMNDWTPAGENAFVSKFGNAGNRSWYFAISNGYGGRPFFSWTEDGSTVKTVSAPSGWTPPADGARTWLRVTLDVDDGAGGHVVTFYTSTDGYTWTQFSQVVGAGTTSIFDSTNDVLIGARGPYLHSGSTLQGTVYEVDVRNGIDGYGTVPRMPELYPKRPYGGTPPPVVPVVGAPTLHVVNGSHPGADAVYLAGDSIVRKMTPDFGQCAAIISTSHNEGTATGSIFFTRLDALVAKIKARLPYAAIAATTQNPKRAGTMSTTEGIKAHTARNSQLFSWCARNGYGIVDGYGAFIRSGVPLSTLVNADGIHPETVGSETWAGAMIYALRQRA